MYLSSSNYKNVLRVIGFVFICGGLIMGYSALETMLDPNATVMLNGVSRSDLEAKLSLLVAPCIITAVGIWLCFSNEKSLTNLHKVRESFWSIFHGK